MDTQEKLALCEEWETGYSLDAGGYTLETATGDVHGTVLLADGGLDDDLGLCDLQRIDGKARDRSCVDLYVIDTDELPPTHVQLASLHAGEYNVRVYRHVTTGYQLYETDHDCWMCGEQRAEQPEIECPRCNDGEGIVTSPGGYVRGYECVTTDLESLPALWSLIGIAGLASGESFVEKD